MKRLWLKYRKKVNLGKHVMIAGGARIRRSTLESYSNIAHDAEITDSIIGARSSIGRYTKIRKSVVGKYCSVSWNVTIGADGHPIDRVSGSAAFFQKRFGLVDENLSKGMVPLTTIGNDVLIGCGSIIVAGVTVGDGAVIGAGSVVIKDVKPYEVVAGVPAKIIGKRFEDYTVAQLLETKWWDWDDQKINKNIHLFMGKLDLEKLDELIGI